MKKNILCSLLFSFTFFALQSVIAQSLTDSLKAHYTFNRTTLDISPTNSHLDSNSSLSWTSFFGSDSAIYFNGTNRISTIGSFDNSYFSQSSVSLWVKTDSINSKKRVILQGANMGFGIYLNPNNKVCAFLSTPSISAVCSDTTIVDNTWHHIVAQNDGDTTFLYVDSKFVEKKYQPLMVGDGSSNNKIYVGNKHDYSFPFSGSINDLRIYNRLLTQSEIDSLSTFPKFTVGLDKTEDLATRTTLYPNPTNGAIKISFDQLYSGQLLIRNTLGQVVFKKTIAQEKMVELEITGKSGVYFVELIDLSGHKVNRKLIKK